MISLTNATLSLAQLPLRSSSITKLPFPQHISTTRTLNFSTASFFPRKRESYSINFGFKNYMQKGYGHHHGRVCFSRWEEPDEGSESEFEEEEEENDLDFESDWEGDDNGTTAEITVDGSTTLPTSNYEEDLVKEVEQLLSSEEKEILQQNEVPNLEKISTSKWNPLHTFALAGQIHYMDDLIENGVDIDVTDNDGLTALHHAIVGKKEPVISHLLRKGANPQLRDLDGATPLHYAIQVGAMQTVKLLIKYKVDLNVADNEGWTPLHVAVQSRNRDILKILLVNGADKSRRNKDGRTPLDIGFCYGKDFKSYDLVKLLKIVPANRD
ncbi:hypothetical protein LIER_25966 [Lithospermum erythrorhizon]|uniref:Ankyrin repeat domain-containing protein EMB506, chloroplastic n=1 Tax=Lithospermum erythrorhizon TaxID=34254 RepID=A0AAV3RAQ0_LITER